MRRLSAGLIAAAVLFAGQQHRNLEPTDGNGPIDFLRWQFTRDWPKWKRLASEPSSQPEPRVASGRMRVTFVNHATALIQMDGMNVLTDPIWSDRVSPIKGVGPRRYHPPGIRWEQLPKIDIVLISHNHYDHLDLATLRRLSREHQPVIFAGSGTRKFLEASGVHNARDLGWWESSQAGQLRVTATPAKHWSGRKLLDRNRTLWCGFVVEGPAGRVFYAGDTAWGGHFDEIARKYSPVRLALLPIGSYKPEWYMGKSHISPEQAVRVHEIVRAGTSIGVHHGTFRMGDEEQDEPVRELRAAIARRPTAVRFVALDPGKALEVQP